MMLKHVRTAKALLAALGLLTGLGTGPAMADAFTISEITGPLSFKDGGQEYALPGLFAPTDRQPLRPWLNQTIDAQPGPADRWGRIALATPLIAGLLQKGLVQLQPVTSPPDPAALAAEDEARQARRGLWAEACCRVLSADSAGKGLNSWRIIHGKIVSITARRNQTYLNFGPDWRTDFTVVVPARLARTLQPEAWQGREVDVRGYVEWRYGPSITLSHAAQISLSDPAKP